MHKPIEEDLDYIQPKRRTICRCHVELYHRINTLDIDKKIKLHLLKVVNEAYGYGIKMDAKLQEYSGKAYQKEIYEDINDTKSVI